MTHQSNQTNGASLEDCHTNFFALTDLCGIKWRKFVNSERPNASNDPLDDPILRSYSRCMQADILCVWRRIQSTKQDINDLNALGEEVNNTKVHPPLSLAAAKELWIFWYGEEPELTELVDAELLRVAANQMTWNGTWERGLTYECRSLLFKALHNLMERFVLTKDIVRFGKWFVQPCTSNERIFTRSSQHLSFSFTFFVHGDTVCASIDLREHPAVRPLTKEHLSEAAAAFAVAATAATSTNANANTTNNILSPHERTSPNSALVTAGNEIGNSRGNNGTGRIDEHSSNNPTVNGAVNAPKKPRKVILAPFGMAATLTGNSYTANDPMAEKILEDWASFFPLCNKENSDVPPVVEVLSGGHKMYHPSIYVLVTDLDDMEEMEVTNALQNCQLDANTSSSGEAATALMALQPSSIAANNQDDNLLPAIKKSLLDVGTSSTTSTTATTAINNRHCNTQNSNIGSMTTTTLTAATTSASSIAPINVTTAKSLHMAERLKINQRKYQPCYDDSITSNYTCNTTNTHALPQAATEMPERAWQDCVTNSLLQKHTAQMNVSVTDGFSVSPTVTADNTTEQIDVKPNPSILMQKQQQQRSQQLWHFVDPTQKAPCICTRSLALQYNHPSAVTPGRGTPLHAQSNNCGSGASSYSRNSLVETMPVPSVGSPGTPAPSPHPNSILSQPSSVQPSEQLLGMSPRAPTSLPNSLQSPNLPEHILDKNTPAPTPTDQHDSKSVTTSPYVHPTPSVEPSPIATVESNAGCSNYNESPNPYTNLCNSGNGSSIDGVGGNNGTLNSTNSMERCGSIVQQHQQHSISTQAQKQQMQQHHHQQQQQQPIIGTITVKKFDLQPTLLSTALGNNINYSTNLQHPLPSRMDIKLESKVSPNTTATISPNNNIAMKPNSSSALILPNNLKRNAAAAPLLSSSSSSSSSAMATTAALYTNSTSSLLSSNISSFNALNEFISLYKPPKIHVKDIDSFINDDCLKLDALYDFNAQDAWSYHNIKRFKHNDVGKSCRVIRTKNLYESHMHIKPLMPSPRSMFGSQLFGVGGSKGVHHGVVGNSNVLGGVNSLMATTTIKTNDIPSERSSNNTTNTPEELSKIKTENNYNGCAGTEGSSSSNNFFQELDIKTEVIPNNIGGIGANGGTFNTSPCKDSKSGIGGNLFTVEGLNPSPKDLEQLFETSSNDECVSMQIHTPPDSNNPSNVTTIEELKRNTATVSVVNNITATATAAMVAALQNCNNSTCITSGTPLVSTSSSASSSLNNSVNNMAIGANTIQAEDLTKMFPTPPSHEQHHPNSSPCQMDVHMTDLSVTTSLTPILDTGVGGMLKIKQEYSVELGSPIEEPIEDWSYVYRPPQQTKFVGSSKYAPLTNLPSQSMPPFTVPANSVYKPSWQQSKSRSSHPQQQKQQQQQHNQSTQQHHQPSQQQQQQQHIHQQHHQLQELLSSAPRTPLQQPRTPLGPMSSSPMHNTVATPLGSGSGGSSLLLNQLNCPQAALTNATSSMQQMMQRAGMSPISPASYVPFPNTSPMMQPQQQRHTPIHPPPPYEVAVASPALSTSSSTAAYINKQYHSQEPPRTPQSLPNLHSIGGPPSVSGMEHHGFSGSSLGIYSASGGTHTTPATLITREFPEVSSLIVNILLYDTALNVFRDHNFDSSTVCVCNADSQRIGNIRGADSGVYVPLPGTTFNPVPVPPTPTATAGNGRTLSAFGAVSNSSGIRNALDSPASLAGAGSSSSTTPSTTTPASNSQQHITGYVDDDSVECTCGFSSVINRRLAYKAGLFYEDELEITGFADDPKNTKEQSLISLLNSISAKSSLSSNGENSNTTAIGATDKAGDQLAYTIFDLLLDQCSIIQTSSSAIHRTLQRHRRRLAKKRYQSRSVVAIANVLEYKDAMDIISLALEQARLAFDNSRLEPIDQHLVTAFSSNGKICSGGVQGFLSLTTRTNVHKWPYIPVGFSRSNKDIVATMKSIQPMLQNAFHSKSRSAAGTKDATYTVSGPLTWRQFHRLAGRASGQCEPQPIPSIIVGHDKDWISVAPLAIHYWDKFLLEPYTYARDVVYLAIAPNNDYIISKTKTYFKELSSTYEMCKLGRHTPICGWGGLLTVDQRTHSDKTFTTNLDNWLCTLDDSGLVEKLRMYAHAFQHILLPYLQRIPSNKSLLNPPDINTSNLGSCTSRLNTSGNITSSPTIAGAEGNSERGDQQQQHPPSNTMEHSETMQPLLTGKSAANDGNSNLNDTKTGDIKPDIKPSLILSDPLGVAETLEEINPAALVLYVVEPFSYGSDSPEIERLACIAILRMYAELLKGISDTVKANINIQIISLESVLELGRTRNRRRFSDEIKCLALNIFSQCRRHLVHAQTVKSLTGFGTAANMEVFLKNKDEQNRRPFRMYTPPYVLAPIHEKNDKTDFSRMASNGMRASPNDQKYSVMYCNYCMSEDQSWLLATVTDDRGEMLEKACINIDVPNRARRRKAPARRIGLSKLMDYIMGIISQTTQTWRLVIGRIGRIGHSELKSWSALLSKQNLQKATKQLKDMCKQCQLMYPPSILSACLVTLEPDSKLRVMPDQFTPDERFSQISIQNPLSTPQDVTCTHILVFPTSAVCLSFTRQFQNEPQVDLDNDFLNFEEDEEPFNDTDLDDLLIWENRGISDNNSPDRNEDNPSWQSAGGNNFNSTQQQDVEEVGAINQQPLAVGYLVSTAPTGRMPSWFWAACPHLEDVCPVFLKTALHLHVPNIQTTDDILNSTNAHSSANDHPLDSTLTADVLRYVLEGYNALSWLALDSNTHDRLSCLPINVQTLMDLYFLTAAIG